jgi:hypothetical protein
MIQRNDLIPQIQALYEKYKGKVNPEYNHGGIDNTADILKDGFNDYRWFWLPKINELYLMPATTGPGLHAIQTRDGGAAKLSYGFCEDTHVIDIHARSNVSFAHEAFCQRPEYNTKELTIQRLNRDGTPSGKLDVGNWFGINIHRASFVSDVVTIGLYSEGCQVAQNHIDHEKQLAAAKETSMYKANPKCLWSYLLFGIDEIKL